MTNPKSVKIALLLLPMLLGGCTTTRPTVTHTLPVLHLDAAQNVRTAWGFGDTDVTLPPGDYIARYADEHGVFYAPQGALQSNGRTMDKATVQVKDGQAVGLWIDGAKVIWPLERPIPLGK